MASPAEYSSEDEPERLKHDVVEEQPDLTDPGPSGDLGSQSPR